MISRCQSDIILSNRFIETHYKRVDKSLEKCKALLRGIQKEFKKTRDFWEQLKFDEKSVNQRSGLSCDNHDPDSKNSEESSKNEDVVSKNNSKVANVSSKTAKCFPENAGMSSKKADEHSKNACGSAKFTNNSSENLVDFQEENIRFSKISKIDVKHLEAFLDIVQKTQLTQCANRNEFNSIEDYSSSDLEIFEDALCQLSSVTSLTFDSLTSSSTDVSIRVHNLHLVEKSSSRVEHNEEEEHSSSCFNQYSDIKLPESLTEEVSMLNDSKLDQIYTYNNNLLDNSKKLLVEDVDDSPAITIPNISESGRLKNETRMTSFDESDSDDYQEACDFSNPETIEENKPSPFFFHANVPKGKMCDVRSKNIGEIGIANDKIIDKTVSQKFLNTNVNKNERVVKFSGNNQVTYKNDGSKVERDKGEFHKYQRKYSEIEKQMENRSRPRIRVTKQRKLIKVKQKDRSKTRSRSRKKSYHDIAVGTSDLDLFEYFHQWPQRLLKQRDPFYSLPAKRRFFDYSTEEPSGIFHPSLLQPYNFSDQYNGKQGQNELFIRKHTSWSSLFKQPLSNNELSDNGSNNTYSLKRSSSSDQGTFSMKNEDYLSEDRFSIHNSTILNNSNTNIYVFRSFEDRFKPPQAPDSDKEICFDSSNAKKPFEQTVYSGSESSRGRASSTDRKLKKKKYLTVKKRKQVALNDEKNNLAREMKQNDCLSGTCNSKEGASVSKLQAVVSYVGHIHSDHIEIPQCTQLLNETKILNSQHTLVNSMRNCSQEALKSNECVTRKPKRHSSGESDLVGKKNIDIIFNNKSKLCPDSEKQRVPSREGSMRRPSSSPLSFSSKRDDRDPGIKRPSREDCRLQLVNGRGDIHLSEVYQKSPHNSSTSLNREYTVSKIDKTSTKSVLEPRVIFKISASSDDLRNEKMNSNEHLATINLTKSSSSCSGIESEALAKMKMKKFGKKYVSCNDLINNDHFYSKINIIPLPGDEKGLIQQVSIVGQRLWVQGATISAYKNSFTEQEEEKKAENCKMSTGSDNSRPASSSKKSDFDNNNEKGDKISKNIDNVSKEVTKKVPVHTPHTKIINSKKNETAESKPRFCPYVNKNYSTKEFSTNKSNSYKPSNRSKIPVRSTQLSPNQPVRPKVEDKCKVYEKERIIENNDKFSDITAAVHESPNSNNLRHDTENNNDLRVPNMEVVCGRPSVVVTDGDMRREIDSDNDGNSLKINSKIKITDVNDKVEELDKLSNKNSNDELESLVVKSSGTTDFKSMKKSSNYKNDKVFDSSEEKIRKNLQRNSGDVTVSRRKSQQNSINFKDHSRLPGKTVRFKKRSPSNGRDSSSEENIDKLENLKRIRQNLCSILPNDSPFRQALLNKLNGVEKRNKTSVNNEEVDVFGAPLINSSGGPFYNEHGYPIAHMSGVSLYNSKGIPSKGAYGRPLHTTLKKELAKIVEGSEERRNVFHRMNCNFEEQLLHALQSISNVRMDEFGRVYDTYGRPLFDRYGYLLYDHIGNPLTDAFGRKLTDKYGISIMGPRKKCANVMLTTLSSNESLSSHQSSDERLVKNRTELINRKKDNSKENMWKKCKRQVSFNMDPTIITMNHSESEGEINPTNFKR